jgi:thioredoxin 1
MRNVAKKKSLQKNLNVDVQEEIVVSNIDQTNGKKSSPLWVKIVIGVVIVGVIVGIYFYKNNDREEAEAVGENTKLELAFEEDEKDFGVSEFEGADFDLHVETELDLDTLKSYNLPIIIDFGADSCIPCKEMAPVLVKLNTEFEGKAIIKFVDVWKYQSLSEGYPIKVIPTQVHIPLHLNTVTGNT